MAIKPLPRPASYPGRKSGKYRKGLVLKEVGIPESHPVEGDYWKLIQLIKWDDGEEFIRFGYYVKDYGASEKHWRYGSQTTLQLPRPLAKKLVRMALERGIL